MKYIASCSFGKDSIATILLALEHHEPLDMVVYVETMFDENISGEYPEHIEWIKTVAIPRLEAMGVKVVHLKTRNTMVKCFFRQLGERSKYAGKIQGYLITGMCKMNSEGKVKEIHSFLKNYPDRVEYIGIALDEPKRLARLDGIKKVSLLAKYGYTERMAYELCQRYDLLSPLYQLGTRGGCWFCPNTRPKTAAEFKLRHPDLWQRLVDMGKADNMVCKLFNYRDTIEEFDAKLDKINELKNIQQQLDL